MLFGAIGCDSSASSTPDVSSPAISTPISPSDSSDVSDSSDASDSSTPSTPTDPELPDESEPATPPANDLKNLKKILIIGNSHSGNIFDPLPDVFRAQGYNDYTFGSASVGGCTITMHKGFIEKNEAAYGYKISKPDVSNGKYVKKTDGTNLYTLSQVLTDEVWDIVYIQIGIVEIVAEDMCKADRDYVVDYIKETCTNPDVKIGYSNSWVSPYSDNAADLPTLDKHYGDNGIDYRRPIKQHNDTIRLFEKNIFTDSNYYSAIHVGTAILYANKMLGLPTHTGIDDSKPTLFAQKSDGRPDFLHLSTYGKILAAYSFFAQYTGAEVKEIKLSHKTLNTQAVKDYIIQSVEYSRTNAWTKWTNEEA